MTFLSFVPPSRRRTGRFTIIALIAIFNLAFPRHVFAQNGAIELKTPSTAVCLPVGEEIAVQPNRLPEIQSRPAKRTIQVVVTAYSSTVDQTDGDPFTTASGSKVHDGTVAFNALPFGTKVRFPDRFGEKIFVVEDRLSSRAGPFHADIWMPTRSDALQWGKRTLTMEIL